MTSSKSQSSPVPAFVGSGRPVREQDAVDPVLGNGVFIANVEQTGRRGVLMQGLVLALTRRRRTTLTQVLLMRGR